MALGDMVKASARFLDLPTNALARNDSKTAWLWTLENGDGKGGHCHLLVHVPAALCRSRRLQSLSRTLGGKRFGSRSQMHLYRHLQVSGVHGLRVTFTPSFHANPTRLSRLYTLKRCRFSCTRRIMSDG